MLTNLSVVSPYQDRLLISISGIETLTEVIHRDTDSSSTSKINVTFSGVQVSGLIKYLYYEIYDGDIWATNTIEFLTVPSGLDTITISGTIYTFVNTLSGINNVPIRNTAELNAVALYRVINAEGTPGTDFWPGQVANRTVSGIIADNPLSLRMRVSGVIGNACRVTTTSEAIRVVNEFFAGGRDYEPITPQFFGALGSGIVNVSGNGTYSLQDVPYSALGQAYLTHLWFANASGTQALDPYGNLVNYWFPTPKLTGRTYLPYYAEVSGLVGYNLYSGGIPSDGVLGLIWSDTIELRARSGMNTKLAFPNASGIQPQVSGLYSYADQGQLFDYVIFAFKSSSGSSPQAPWPRTTDANGIWYYAGKTTRTSAVLYLPPVSTSKFSVWVGFGNKDTRKTSGLPFNSTLSSIYIQ
jgi:hypothetical protein